MTTGRPMPRCIFRGCHETADEQTFITFPEWIDDMPRGQRVGRTPPLCTAHMNETGPIIGNLSLPPERRDPALSRVRIAYDHDQVANRFRELWIEPIDEAEGPA